MNVSTVRTVRELQNEHRAMAVSAEARPASTPPTAPAAAAAEAVAADAAVPAGYRPGEKVEMDTAAGYDDMPLDPLLLPEGGLSLHHRNFALAYNSSALKGWVKQGSPCCAACSTAGAWNSVLHLDRDAPGAHSQATVLEVMAGLLRDRRDRERASLERALLVKDVDELLAILTARVEKTGKMVGGRKAAGVKPKECVAHIRQHCMDMVLEKAAAAPGAVPEEAAPLPADPAAAGPGFGMPENVWESLIDAWAMTPETVHAEREEERRQGALTAAAAAAALAVAAAAGSFERADAAEGAMATVKGDGEEEEEEEGRGFDDDEDDEELVATVNMGKKKPAGKAARKTSGKAGVKKGPPKKDLQTLVNESLTAWLRAVIALAQLTRAAPSTAGIGNWGILQAMNVLAEAAAAEENPSGMRVKGSVLMGRGSGVAIKVKATDDAAAAAKQWHQLRQAFDAPNSALLFHLTNHYALVFAMRSWTTPDGAVNREILTARKGQRPNTWLPFERVREIVLGWGGYKVMQIVDQEGQPEPAPEAAAAPLPDAAP